MRIGYLDCFAGVAGDMWVGALLDAGLDFGALEAAVASMRLPGVRISQRPVRRAGLAARHFVVETATAATAHRHLADLLAIARRAILPESVRLQVERVFGLLAEVEARAHGVDIDAVHFHEVGGEDTIVDVVCACLGVHLLGLQRLYASAVTVGTGTVDCEHGTLPVPPPGVLGNLSGIPVRTGFGRGECATPTGAALLRALVTEFEPQLTWVPERSGLGAGTRDVPDYPNVLRLTVGELHRPGPAAQLVEVNLTLDTATGEDLGALLERLRDGGVVDAFASPVQMKKGRPGYQITALVGDAERDAIVALLLEESTSLGVRMHRVERAVLERWPEARATTLGIVQCKCARLPSGAVVCRPEDDEIERLAREHGLPRRVVAGRLASELRPV